MGDLHVAFAADTGVAREISQRQNPELNSRLGATRPSEEEGVDAAISARFSEDCNRVSG